MLRLTPSNQININELINSFTEITTFIFDKGDYHLTEPINITRPNITLLGETRDSKDVHFYMDTVNHNLLNIKDNNVSVQFISFHVVAEAGSGICLTQDNSNRVQVTNCAFYGAKNNFAVSFSGHSNTNGANSAETFENAEFDQDNGFNNNIVYGSGTDAINVAYQNNFNLSGNIVRGGKINVNMSTRMNLSNNYLDTSSSQGILINLPVFDCYIVNNKIRASVNSGIALKPIDSSISDTEDMKISIVKNEVKSSKYFGLELNRAHYAVVENNLITYTTEFAIYVLRSNNVKITDNRMYEFKRGIVVDVENTLTQVKDNVLASLYPTHSEIGIIVETSSVNINVENNTLSGKYLSNTIKDVDNVNTVLNNRESEFHDFRTELTLL